MLDILITGEYVITMTGEGLGIIENGAVGVKGNGIEVVGRAGEIKSKYRAHRVMDAPGQVIMPGLIDAHIHTGINILRGLSQDVDNWMQEGLWPFASCLQEEGMVKGSLVNIIEGVKAGTTTFCDYTSPMQAIVKNHVQVGSRARVTDVINELSPRIRELEVGELYPFDPAVGQEKLENNITLLEEWHERERGRITCTLGPQGPDMLSKELLLEVRELAERYSTSIHMHVAQGDREINQMEKRYNQRSIPFLDELGYLNEKLMAVHLTEATAAETHLLAERGASMILCSGSIAIIDGIVPPLREFLQVSSRAGLGSDQTPGNNCSNMFNEMKLTALLNKCRARDPQIMPAWQVMRLATIEGARAIGLGNEIGSLQPGKKADIIILNLNTPAFCPHIKKPFRNIVPNLVYSARGDEVDTVIIDGQVVMEGRKLLTVDEGKAIREAQEEGEILEDRCQKAGIHTPLVDMMEQDRL